MCLRLVHQTDILHFGLQDALKSAGNKGHLTTIEFYEKRQSIARENIEKCCPERFCHL